MVFRLNVEKEPSIVSGRKVTGSKLYQIFLKKKTYKYGSVRNATKIRRSG